METILSGQEHDGESENQQHCVATQGGAGSRCGGYRPEAATRYPDASADEVGEEGREPDKQGERDEPAPERSHEEQRGCSQLDGGDESCRQRRHRKMQLGEAERGALLGAQFGYRGQREDDGENHRGGPGEVGGLQAHGAKCRRSRLRCHRRPVTLRCVSGDISPREVA